jgi:hypothetical protein
MAMAHVSPIELELSCPGEVAKQTSTQLEAIEHFDPKTGKAQKEEQEMTKQIIKSLAILALVVGLMAAVVASAYGQSSTFITADIPFDFVVGGKTLPSSEYTVRMPSSNGLRISSSDGKSSAMRLSNLAVEKSKERNARMVFHRYGQQYFLAEVWFGNNYGRQLLRCDQERHVQQELASKASKSETAKASYEIVEVIAQVR